ncbi:MAG: nucleotide exchange factor GrpE [Defluviitaleaceae bacterium]|nr:nucleotide exchange factor GrpE [Defluviitaleaceae bacterium]
MSGNEHKVEPAHEYEADGETAECVPEAEVELCEPETHAANELAGLNDKYLRVLAEFDNFRKRTAKEKAGMYDDGVVEAVTKFLPVIDNLRRALDSASQQSGDPLYKGVDMILSQLLKTLGELGVEEIAAVGEPFDPNRHFAVAHAEDSNYSENTVAEELQKGYKYKDKVLRHSMVKVAN